MTFEELKQYLIPNTVTVGDQDTPTWDVPDRLVIEVSGRPTITFKVLKQHPTYLPPTCEEDTLFVDVDDLEGESSFLTFDVDDDLDVRIYQIIYPPNEVI